MRRQLANFNGKVFRFEANFIVCSKQRNSQETLTGHIDSKILLRNIYALSNPQIKTDHLWVLNLGELNKYNPKRNDIIRFDAKIVIYHKGNGYKFINKTRQYVKSDYEDFTLTNLKNIIIIGKDTKFQKELQFYGI